MQLHSTMYLGMSKEMQQLYCFSHPVNIPLSVNLRLSIPEHKRCHAHHIDGINASIPGDKANYRWPNAANVV